MQFVLTAYDGAGMLEKRMEVRPKHLENLSQINGKVVCAGGLLDENGKMKGSVMVMEFASRDDFDDYLEKEPYVIAKVWEKVIVETINVVMLDGKPVVK